MRIRRFTASHFRCFDRLDITFTHQLVIVEGPNGAGKSSLIEAIAYCGYLKSFRHAKTQDLVTWDAPEKPFLLALEAENEWGESLQVQVGAVRAEKRVRVNDAPIRSHKELLEHIRMITLAEHDLALVQDGPDARRIFMNQLCILHNPSDATLFTSYKHILDQRNQLLHAGIRGDSIRVWTEQLWHASYAIRALRAARLGLLEREIALCAQKLGLAFGAVEIEYRDKSQYHDTFEAFWQRYAAGPLIGEYGLKRSLFGAHLDDCFIQLAGKEARSFASRGQQKLILLLIKLSLAQQLKAHGAGGSLVLLLDDFLTDLDLQVASSVLRVVEELGCMVMVTCPLKNFISFTGAHQRISFPLSEHEIDLLKQSSCGEKQA